MCSNSVELKFAVIGTLTFWRQMCISDIFLFDKKKIYCNNFKNHLLKTFFFFFLKEIVKNCLKIQLTTWRGKHCLHDKINT